MQTPRFRPALAAMLSFWLAVWLCLPGMVVWSHADGSMCLDCPQSAPSKVADECCPQTAPTFETAPDCRQCCEPQQQERTPDFSVFAPFVAPVFAPQIRAVLLQAELREFHPTDSISPRIARGPPPSRGPPSMNVA